MDAPSDAPPYLAAPPGSAFKAGRAARALLRAGGLASAATALLGLLLLCRAARRATGGDGPDRLFARAAAQTCRLLGPTFVKMAQIASTRPDLVPVHLHRELAALRQSVSPRPFSSLAPGLPEPLRAALRAGRLKVREDPLASGSIAHVFEATEADTGRRIVLKIQRPGLRELLHADFRVMNTLGAAALRLPPFRTLPIARTLAELEDLILRQTDFRLEAANVREFAARYADWPDLVIPELCEELTGGSALAMSLVPGLDSDWMGSLPCGSARRQVRIATDFLFHMVFVAGRVHVDLHPGNLVFRADGTVAVVDFGMVAEMAPAARRMFVYFFFGLITNSPGMCTHVLLATALGRREDFDEELFAAAVARLIGRYTALNAAEYEVSAFIGDLFALQRAHGLHPSPDFLTTVLAFLMLEGTVKALDPGYDFQAAARDYILKNVIRSGIFAR
jgi:ubiquinone biosynthesis protein